MTFTKINRILLGLSLLLSCHPSLLSQNNTPDEKVERKRRREALPQFEKNWLLGRIDYQSDSRFTRVKKSYTRKEALYLHRRVYSAFRKMHRAALKDKIHLEIISGARSFEDQKRIWQKKWRRLKDDKKQGRSQEQRDFLRAKKILKYSAMPGSSRHHWGTDVDLNALKNNYFQKGEGRRLYLWLQGNAKRFGFCQVYTEKSKKDFHGYAKELWHWSYMPLALPLSRSYLKRVRYEDIKGFSGARLASKLKIIERYVAGTDPDCKL